MAAKLLHSLADDNPDLEKQIGCMNGIFQLFDRHHIVTTRRVSRTRLPPGNSHFNYDSQENDSNSTHQRQTAVDTRINKVETEKQKISTESSRASFTSCSSSMCSLDYNAQEDAPLDPVVNQKRTSSTHLRWHSLNLRDMVKDSMYREARGLSKKEATICAMKLRDSPSPLQLSKSVDGEQSVSIDLKESTQVLAKLKKAPSHNGEAKELPRLSYEVKDGHWHSILKDAPRFSCDGRGMSHLSFESHDTIKCPPKLKDLPRLSLDSREVSWHTYSSDSKASHLSRNFITDGASTSHDKVSSLRQSSATQSRPPSVVAKLMGLEAFPEFYLVSDTQSSLSETGSTQGNCQFSKTGLTKPLLQPSNSLKNSLNDLASPRCKNPDSVVKPISSSRFPIEPAPWKEQNKIRSSQEPSSRAIKAPTRTPDSFPSVYGEIEKRLKDLEFKQSERDLRALKRILEAMQLSQIQNSGSVRQQTIKESNSARTSESPIVIMKPAKLVKKTGNSASSVIPIGGLHESHKLHSGVLSNKKKGIASSQMPKDQSPRNSHKDASTSSSDKKVSSSKTIKLAKSKPKCQQVPKENNPSSVRNSGSVSPRMQQKKLELERRSRQPTLPSDSNKPSRQSSKQTAESDYPGRKLRSKVHNSLHVDDQLSDISIKSRSLSFQGDDISMQSNSVTIESKMDMEVSSILQSAEIIDGQSPSSMKATEQLVSGSMKKKSIQRLDEDETIAELATDAPDHPSPISVLDVSVYKDDMLSPVKLISNAPKVVDAQEYEKNRNTDQWNPADSLSVNRTGSGEINRKKLQSIDHLVQKLRRLNSSHEEDRIDCIASLCENTNPDHRYITEILLASSLLLKDLSSELLTFQHRSPSHPINPEFFLVLEQTKVNSLLSKEESIIGKASHLKLNTEKFHRKLIFDVVNEILGTKLGSSPEPWLKPNGLTKKIFNAQKLLKELCFEIEKIQSKKPQCSLEDEGHGLKSMLREDVMNRSESWTDFHCETPGIVLDVERLIFKDLVEEIVIGEAASLQVGSGRPRKLFRK